MNRATRFLLGTSVFLSSILLAHPAQAAGSPLAPIYFEVLHQIDRNQLITRLKEMTGVLPVSIGGQATLINERYSPAAKAKFREYWTNYYRSLGINVQEMTYKTEHKNLEEFGHNLEAVLPGKSADSIVIIVHYDSMGPEGQETTNPGVDDDMTGMAVQLETARLFAMHRNLLQYTVRFVAADFEEWDKPGLEGARKYAHYIKNLSETQHFRIVSAIDDEQSGWNCVRDGKCIDGSTTPKLLINDCADDARYTSKEFSQKLIDMAPQITMMPVVTSCAGQDSDHYAMWEIGIPALEYGEFSWQNNDHFDSSGGDIYSKIDEDYFFTIAQVGIVFSATQAGLDSTLPLSF